MNSSIISNGVRTDNRLENLELWSVMQPKGQRVDDKVDFALEILRRYRPEFLGEMQWQPRRNSNPCLHLERAASWTSRRRGHCFV